LQIIEVPDVKIKSIKLGQQESIAYFLDEQVLL